MGVSPSGRRSWGLIIVIRAQQVIVIKLGDGSHNILMRDAQFRLNFVQRKRAVGARKSSDSCVRCQWCGERRPPAVPWRVTGLPSHKRRQPLAHAARCANSSFTDQPAAPGVVISVTSRADNTSCSASHSLSMLSMTSCTVGCREAGSSLISSAFLLRKINNSLQAYFLNRIEVITSESLSRTSILSFRLQPAPLSESVGVSVGASAPTKRR